MRASLVAGTAVTAAWLGYGVAIDAVPFPVGPGFIAGALLLYGAMAAVPFAVGAGAAYLALRHRVLFPAVAVVGYAAAPATVRLETTLIWVSVLVAGPLVVVPALVETLLRARLGRLANPPSLDGWRAIALGATAAVGYAGIVALRALLPLWRIDTGAPPRVPPTTQAASSLWYVLGLSLVLVGLPVASNRRFGLLSPVVGLLGFLLVDLAFIQPAVARGEGLVLGTLLAVWPTLAVGLSVLAVAEWWLRTRRGDYDERDEGGDDGEDVDRTDRDDDGLTVEGGFFGDRV